MKLENENLLKSYWNNESEIQGITERAGATIDEIVNDPDAFSYDIVFSLEGLLEKKESILLRLAPIQRSEITQSEVVDLTKYRHLVSCVSF